MSTALAASRPRAAQYVRMSTDHQQYSTQNQGDKITEYARQRNIDIVRTYADEGKSGLSFGGRAALQKLIADVESGTADFEIILVYDVSRWGRFQDADESAYYEYICRRAGIPVAYCAEQFENDGSPVSTIVKGVKRAMAGEYSRELSAKVFAGQCRLIELGYRQGGVAGFGLRRVMIDQHGEFKGELKTGEYKSIQTYRVILVPGPEEEVRIVNDIFHWLIREDLFLSQIATRLNNMGVLSHTGNPWSDGNIREILTNEKYIGNNVFNRRSVKLRTANIRNPPEMWIRKEDAFEGIVPSEVFFTAKAILISRIAKYTEEDLLQKLRMLLERSGALSEKLIEQAADVPTLRTYKTRFGSLRNAYERIGYQPSHESEYWEINRRMRRLHPEIIENTNAAIVKMGGTVWRDPDTDLLHVNEELVVCIVLTRCQTLNTGVKRWRVRFDPAQYSPDITIVVRLQSDNQEALDYYLLPKLDQPRQNVNILDNRECHLDCFRFDNLDYFYGMAARNPVLRPRRLPKPFASTKEQPPCLIPSSSLV